MKILILLNFSLSIRKKSTLGTDLISKACSTLGFAMGLVGGGPLDSNDFLNLRSNRSIWNLFIVLFEPSLRCGILDRAGDGPGLIVSAFQLYYHWAFDSRFCKVLHSPNALPAAHAQ